MQQPTGAPLQGAASAQERSIRSELATLTAALQEMEDLYQCAPCGFHSVDRNRMILKINDTELKWLGYQRAEVVGKLSISDLVAPESHAAMAQCFAGLLAGTALRDQKFVMRRKNGETFTVSANVSAMRDGGGNLFMTCASLVDLSERARMEAEPGASEQRFRGVFENAAIGMALIAPDGSRFEVNDALCRMLGYDGPDLLPQDCQSLTYPEDRAAERIARQRLLAGEISFCHLDKRCMHKDGRVVWARLSLTLARDAQGMPLHFVALIEDITARKKTLAALRMSEECFRGAFQHAAIGMALTDLDGRWTRVNQALCQMLGYAEPQLLTKGFLDVTHPDDVRFSIARLRQLLSGELSYYHIEKRYIHSDGHSVWAFVSITQVCDEQGLPLHHVEMIEDITERKQAENALLLANQQLVASAGHLRQTLVQARTNEARLRAIFDNVADGIITIDDCGHIETINPAAERIFGYPENEVIGLNIKMLMPEPQHGEHDGHLKNYRETGRGKLNVIGLSREVLGLRKDGAVFPLELSISEMQLDGRRGFSGIVRDISERKQAETALQLAQQKLRELVAHQERIKEYERTRIAREIHDELGSVLTGVKANLSVAMDQDERAGNAPNQRLLDACALLDAAVDTVRRVITDLRPSVLDQLGVWAALEWLAEQTEVRSGLRCRVSIDARAAQSVIDPERSTALFRILQETLTNVVRHAQASQVEIRVTQDKGLVRMEVEDNGKGIDAGHSASHNSWGIAGMVERARYFGGDIRIADTAHGTLLALRLPLESPDEA